MPSRLQQALRNGLAPGGNLADELFRLGEYHITTIDDAEEVCEALRQFPLPPSSANHLFPGWTPLHAVAALFQQVESDTAMAVLSEHGVPELIRVFDALLADHSDTEAGRSDEASGGKLIVDGFADSSTVASTSDEQAARRNEIDDALLFVLKILVMYQNSEGIARVIDAARRPLKPESFLWAIVFEQFEGVPSYLPWLFKELRRPLPPGFIAVALLDCANQALLAGHVDQHPFDTPMGRALLESWLVSATGSDASYAVSAAAAIPHLSPPHRPPLLALALDHGDMNVQLEGAWASAQLGHSGGLKLLRRLCLTPATSAAACTYLRELGREDLVPGEALEPDFAALVDMCAWFVQNFKTPPDAIELRDTRELYWPPTNDRRRVWLFKYSYLAFPPDTPSDQSVCPMAGYGMVGSITFALTNEPFQGCRNPLDVYALYCCWELQINKDPRAPAERSVPEGRRILDEYNPPESSLERGAP